MPTEQKIRELAYAIWEQEGRPQGKDVEHYFRARQILEQQELEAVGPAPGTAPTPPAVEQEEKPVDKRRRAPSGRRPK